METTKYLKYIIPIVLIAIFFLFSIILGIFYANVEDTLWTWANSVTLIGIGLASSISLYGLMHSAEQFNKQIVHSNNQLIEQLTRKDKEKAIFNFLNEIMKIINKQDDDYTRMWDNSIKWIVELDKESKEYSEHNYFDFDLVVQNDIYYYFKGLVNNPHFFNYLPHILQDKLEKFVDDYYGVNTRLLLFLGLHFEGNGDSWKGKEISNVFVLDSDIRSSSFYKLGNYLTRELHNEPYCQWLTHYCSKNYSSEDIKGVIVKIDEETVNKFEVVLSDICVLAYEESLKYGYSEIK